ncbi:MAG: VOC family protein [Burkholderiales bacterium]|nr:VOC family protein [Burkholderiales bacterium]
MHTLDHVVFNARDRMDEVVATFDRLGFQVGARGHHTLGSINHTVVFAADYLELLGFPPGAPPPARPELVARPLGLMATVLGSDDAESTRGDLVAAGLAPRPVQSFSRPVRLPDGGTADARFRVTRLEPDAVPGTWFYYCEHLTRAAVWQAAWQTHPNGVVGIDSLEIALPDPAAAAPAYERCTGSPARRGPDGVVTLALGACTLRLVPASGTTGMRAIGFGCCSLAPARAVLERARVDFEASAAGLEVDPQSALGTTLQFTLRR